MLRLGRRVVLVGAAVALVVVAITVVVVLPVVVRSIAVDRLARMTGRAVALADIDLNLFTGRLSLHRFRMSQRGSADPALEFERLDVHLALPSLLTTNYRVREIALTGPRVYVARLGAARFDFDDLLALIPPPDPNEPPSPVVVTLA